MILSAYSAVHTGKCKQMVSHGSELQGGTRALERNLVSEVHSNKSLKLMFGKLFLDQKKVSFRRFFSRFHMGRGGANHVFLQLVQFLSKHGLSCSAAVL